MSNTKSKKKQRLFTTRENEGKVQTAEPYSSSVTEYDVSITGQWGLYSITAVTAAGKRWMRRNLSSGERTRLAGALMCEGGDRCREIVRAMDRAGLVVTVNGVDMAGFGGRAA